MTHGCNFDVLEIVGLYMCYEKGRLLALSFAGLGGLEKLYGLETSSLFLYDAWHE